MNDCENGDHPYIRLISASHWSNPRGALFLLVHLSRTAHFRLKPSTPRLGRHACRGANNERLAMDCVAGPAVPRSQSIKECQQHQHQQHQQRALRKSISLASARQHENFPQSLPSPPSTSIFSKKVSLFIRQRCVAHIGWMKKE